MKQAIVLMGAVSYLLSFVACNPGAEKKTKEPNITSSTGNASNIQPDTTSNFCLDETTGREMLREFDSSFRTINGKVQNAIVPYIMIEAHTILSISEFLKDTKYDGLRIWMGASQFEEYPDEERKSKMMFIAVPTLAAHDTSHHPDDWDVKIPQSAASKELKINMVKSFSFAAIRKFKKMYRGEGSGSEMKNFTKAIWINGKLIENMAKLLTDNADSLSGFKLFAGAYSKLNSNVESQEYEIQSTILLVPINKADGSENWTIFKNCNITDKGSILDAANHGELCPKNCPPTEP